MIRPFLPPTIELGGLSIHIYGLLLGIGAIIVLSRLEKRFNKQLLGADYLLLVVLALVGARVIFLLHNLEQLLADPTFALNLWDGGLAIHGVIIGLLIALWWISRTRKLSFLSLTDQIMIGLPFAQALGRWGNFFNQELYGKPWDSPFALFIDPQNRLSGYESVEGFHPTFFYESVLNLINGLILLKWHKKYEGLATYLYLVNYGLIRLVMNRIRIDRGYLPLLSIDTSDLASIAMVLIGSYLLIKRSTTTKSGAT